MRKSDTHERVFLAADELLAAGTRPTQQSVRERIGSGSATTIHKALNDWWGALGQRLMEQNSRPGVPDQVVRVADELWQMALRQANSELENQRSILEERASSLKSEREQLRSSSQTEIARINQQLESAYAQIEALNKEVQQLGQELLDSEKRLMKSQTECRDNERKIRELEIYSQKSSSLDPVDTKSARPPSSPQQGLQETEFQKSRADSLQRECSDLERALAQQDVRFRDLQERHAAAQESLFQCKQQEARSTAALERATEELAHYKRKAAQLDDLTQELARAKARLEAKEQEVERLTGLLTKNP